MTSPLSITEVPSSPWGREYPAYCRSYNNKSVAVPLLSADVPHSRTSGIDTINRIRALGQLSSGPCRGDIITWITTPMLLDVHEMTKFPGHLHLIAEPQFVSGCVTLMSSVLPSPLQYEYGYLCFRILVIALNVWLLRQTNSLEDTTVRMSAALTLKRFPIFWDASAEVVYQKDRDSNLGITFLVQVFQKSVWVRLLQLLSSDRKLFLLVLKRTGSLGLSGLLLTSFRVLMNSQNPYGYDENPELFTEIILPYSRILWRYLLLPTISDGEEKATTYLQNLSTSFARLNADKPVDTEDARNVLQEFNERLKKSNALSLLNGGVLMRLVAPLVSPGCEDLVPTTFKRSIDLMWSSLIEGRESNDAIRYLVAGFLLYLRDMIKAIKPQQFTNQPWIWEIVDHVIKEDVAELALRTMLTAPNFNMTKLDHTEAKLLSVTIDLYAALSELAPHQDFPLRFYNSGRLGDWCKYYFFFRVYGNENTYRDLSKSMNGPSTNWACGEIISAIMDTIMGSKWADFLGEMAGSCDNPRCPWPFNARYFCTNCRDLIYCSTECLTADWMYAWGGPHSSVCELQARRNLDSGKRYHRIVNLPEGFKEGFSGRSTETLAKSVGENVRTKGVGSEERPLEALTIYNDNRTRTFKLDTKTGFV